MFRNSRYGWKLGGALALAAAMTATSAWRGGSIHPAAWRCLAEPERWHGVELRVMGEVISRGEGTFVLRWQEVLLEVRGSYAPPPGESVEAVGTLDKDGPHLRLREYRRLSPRSRLRWIWEGISLAVLGLILVNFLRHFAFRPEAARVKGL